MRGWPGGGLRDATLAPLPASALRLATDALSNFRRLSSLHETILLTNRLLIANLLICLCACSRIRARARLRQPILSGDRGSLMRSQVVFIHGFDCDNNRIEDIGECCTYKLVQDPVREGAGAEGTTHVAFKLDDAYRLAKLGAIWFIFIALRLFMEWLVVVKGCLRTKQSVRVFASSMKGILNFGSLHV